MRLSLLEASFAVLVLSSNVYLSALPPQSSPLPLAKPETVGISTRRLARIGTAIQAEIDRKTMPGAVIAIARRGKLVYFEAFGKLGDEAGTPMPRDAIFPLDSMTKPLTAVGALELVEQGRLLLSEPIGTYLPELDKMVVATSAGTEPAKRKPTLLNLMAHTAGVTYGNANGTETNKRYLELTPQLTSAEYLAKLATLPLQYQPGTKWEYGLGLDVTGLAIEAVTKQRLGDYLKTEVFTPLGMHDTSFSIPASKKSRAARPLPERQAGHDGGGGGGYSTVADYVRFAEMLRRGGKLGDVRLLGPKAVAFMTSDQLGPDVNIDGLTTYPNLYGYGFGLSVAVRRAPGGGMLGSTGDYNWGGAGGTYFWVDPKEELTVVLMERAGPARYHMRQLITSIVYQSLQE